MYTYAWVTLHSEAFPQPTWNLCTCLIKGQTGGFCIGGGFYKDMFYTCKGCVITTPKVTVVHIYIAYSGKCKYHNCMCTLWMMEWLRWNGYAGERIIGDFQRGCVTDPKGIELQGSHKQLVLCVHEWLNFRRGFMCCQLIIIVFISLVFWPDVTSIKKMCLAYCNCSVVYTTWLKL